MSVRTYLRRLDRIFLQKCFRFDKWHSAKLQEHSYALDIVNYINIQKSVSYKFGIEVGCGLGDIISNVICENKIGYDIDGRVLKAARFLNFFRFNRNGKMKFERCDFMKDELEGKYDLVIAVNWLHHCEPSELKKRFNKIYANNLTENGLFVIDTVKDIAYEYNHNINLLTDGWNCNLLTKDGYEYSRSVHFISKI